LTCRTCERARGEKRPAAPGTNQALDGAVGMERQGSPAGPTPGTPPEFRDRLRGSGSPRASGTRRSASSSIAARCPVEARPGNREVARNGVGSRTQTSTPAAERTTCNAAHARQERGQKPGVVTAETEGSEPALPTATAAAIAMRHAALRYAQRSTRERPRKQTTAARSRTSSPRSAIARARRSSKNPRDLGLGAAPRPLSPSRSSRRETTRSASSVSTTTTPGRSTTRRAGSAEDRAAGRRPESRSSHSVRLLRIRAPRPRSDRRSAGIERHHPYPASFSITA